MPGRTHQVAPCHQGNPGSGRVALWSDGAQSRGARPEKSTTTTRTRRSRARWLAPLVEPGAVFAHLLALGCWRVALAGRGLVALGRRAPTQLDAVVGVVRHLEVDRTVDHVAQR